MKKVVITGVAGFLGSHIAEKHLQMGDSVLGIDNFVSSDRSSRHFLKLCLKYRNFSFCELDVSSHQQWEGAHSMKLSLRNSDIVYNFACPASPPIYQAHPILTMMTSIVGLEYILKNCQDAVIVQASTSEVYGSPTVSPQSEEYFGNVNSYGPRSCYDEGKRGAEALCFDYTSMGRDVRIVRIFNTYGPHMSHNDGRVVTNFLNAALRNDYFTIYGNGEQTRSFCYVDDLVAAIVKLGTMEHVDGINKPINIGNPTEITINELASTIEKVLSKTLSKRHFPMPQDDPPQRRPDISRAIETLGWVPKVSLEEGIDRFFKYMKKTK